MSLQLKALIKQLEKDPTNIDLINEVAMGYYQTPEMITNDEDLKLFRKTYLIIVGTLVEDFFTAGVGIADDPASFAAAATMYARGAVLWGGGAVVAQKALLPVTTRLSIAITPVGTAVYAH
jgi:hypothetical protein